MQVMRKLSRDGDTEEIDLDLSRMSEKESDYDLDEV